MGACTSSESEVKHILPNSNSSAGPSASYNNTAAASRQTTDNPTPQQQQPQPQRNTTPSAVITASPQQIHVQPKVTPAEQQLNPNTIPSPHQPPKHTKNAASMSFAKRTARTEERYQILKTLGEGASCKVLSVKDRSTHQLHAMKVLNKADKYNKTLYENEVHILHALRSHPNVLQLIDYYEDKTSYHILTVLYTGGELFDQVSKGNFSEKVASTLSREMLRAMLHCHTQNIVHRDLKPENFVFAHHEDVQSDMKLIDFGCAKMITNKDQVISDVAGSPYYVAPEVLDDKLKRTGETWKCSDMWSIGVIIFLLVSGIPPFNSESQDGIFRKIKKGKYRFPSNIELSPAVRDLIGHLLCMNPKDRYTAEQALQHEWIAGDAASDAPLPDTLVTALSAFRTQCRLKKAVARVLSNRMTDDDKSSLADVFTRFDTDGSGMLGATEMVALMKHIGKTQAEAEAAIADMDEDGNGEVSIEEFRAAAVQGKLGNSNAAEMKAAFDVFDTNGDGIIDYTEIERLCDFLSPEVAKAAFAEVDRNKDGKLTFDEWVIMMRDINEKRPDPKRNSVITVQ